MRDERTLGYKQALLRIRNEAKKLKSWFGPQNENAAELLEEIIQQTWVMETSLRRQMHDWAPWTMTLKVEPFLQQLNDVGYALKDINLKVKPLLESAKRISGKDYSPQFAFAGPIVSTGSPADPLKDKTYLFIDDVYHDFQSKTNLKWLDVWVDAIKDGTRISKYTVKCMWTVSGDIDVLLSKRTSYLRSTLGTTSPTTEKPIPPGLYRIYATSNAEGDKSKGSHNESVTLREHSAPETPAYPGSDIILRISIK